MFVQIISTFCFIIFRINSSISVWKRSGKWQKDQWAAKTSKCGWSSTGVEKGPWENPQVAEAARYHEIRGGLFSFGTAQKGRLCWVLNYVSVVQILIGMIFYIPRALSSVKALIVIFPLLVQSVLVLSLHFFGVGLSVFNLHWKQ